MTWWPSWIRCSTVARWRPPPRIAAHAAADPRHAASQEADDHARVPVQFSDLRDYTSYVALVIDELRRRGAALTPGWQALARRHRAWAEKAGARWAAAELAKTEG